MSRQQKRIQREKEIISGTLNLLNEKSFLALRMSDVAKAADCSMGAIYSHFSSKEDLLIGCASQIFKSDIKVVRQVMSHRESNIDKLLLGVVAYLVINVKWPQNFMLRHLAVNPSVWQRASPARNEGINRAIARINKELESIAREALIESGIADACSQMAQELQTGLMALSIGLYEIGHSVFEQFNYEFRDNDGLELHLSNICRFLIGWGFNGAGLLETLHQLYESALILITEGESPD